MFSIFKRKVAREVVVDDFVGSLVKVKESLKVITRQYDVTDSTLSVFVGYIALMAINECKVERAEFDRIVSVFSILWCAKMNSDVNDELYDDIADRQYPKYTDTLKNGKGKDSLSSVIICFLELSKINPLQVPEILGTLYVVVHGYVKELHNFLDTTYRKCKVV